MEEDIYENDYENCECCKCTYYENDTGYAEYECNLITGDAKDCECFGGDIDDGCPLSFKYQIQKK